jgi:hypothetical protein
LKETADAAQVGVGLILFWPALFLVEGGDGAEAQEHSRLKGEKEAIERVSIQKNEPSISHLHRPNRLRQILKLK